jgi:hypothetical protein
VVDSVDIALGTSLDVNADGIPDECQNLSARPRLENWYLKPGNRLVFTLIGQADATYVIEASSDLRKGWIPVYTNTAAQGTFQFVEPAPQPPGTSRFYRARLSP